MYFGCSGESPRTRRSLLTAALIPRSNSTRVPCGHSCFCISSRLTQLTLALDKGEQKTEGLILKEDCLVLVVQLSSLDIEFKGPKTNAKQDFLFHGARVCAPRVYYQSLRTDQKFVAASGRDVCHKRLTGSECFDYLRHSEVTAMSSPEHCVPDGIAADS